MLHARRHAYHVAVALVQAPEDTGDRAAVHVERERDLLRREEERAPSMDASSPMPEGDQEREHGAVEARRPPREPHLDRRRPPGVRLAPVLERRGRAIGPWRGASGSFRGPSGVYHLVIDERFAI